MIRDIEEGEIYKLKTKDGYESKVKVCEAWPNQILVDDLEEEVYGNWYDRQDIELEEVKNQ